MQALYTYKEGLVNIGKTDDERQYIRDCITKWYLRVPKIDIYPSKNILDTDDLVFANKHKNCNFNIESVKKQSNRLYAMLKKSKNTDAIYPNKDGLITLSQKVRLQKLYKGQHFEEDKNKLISIYEFLGMIQLSIPPIFSGIELFGSPLSSHNPYCSPFDFEKRFGSLGSFFNFNLANSKETLFTANPPRDEVIMNKMAKRLVSELGRSKNTKTVIITIPVWDGKSQKKIGIKNNRTNLAAFTTLINSKYFCENTILDRALYPYWDYYNEKLVPTSYSHLIIMSNGEPQYTIKQVSKEWQKFIHMKH